jgi:hypothetical protein
MAAMQGQELAARCGGADLGRIWVVSPERQEHSHSKPCNAEEDRVRLRFPLVVVMALAISSRQSLAQSNSPESATSTNVGGSGMAGGQNLDELRQILASPDYETRKTVVTELLHVGEKRPLDKEEVDLLLPHLKSDSDWRIKVRITAVLPYAKNPDWVLQPLISALEDRDVKSSGGGNVPLYACGALAHLGDSRGLQPVEGWLHYLESYPKVYGDSHDSLVKQTEKRIAELKSKLEKADLPSSIAHP